MSLSYGSTASGIEAATAAWHPLGWKPVWFSQYDPEHNYAKGPDFPSAVLSHRYPHVPNLGDMTLIKDNPYFNEHAIDLLVGGTPCQSFSLAGLRKGLDDERGNLSLEFVRLLMRKRTRWFLWENVPGVLTSGKGRDFATILSAWTGRDIAPQSFATSGIIEGEFYSIAWRVLDAQHFGVPQRRRRVFVVGYLGNNWRAPAAVLFDRESMRGNSTPVIRKRDNKANDHGTIEPASFWNGEQITQTLDAVLYKKQCLPEKSRFPAVLVPAWVPCYECDEYYCTIHNRHASECDCPGVDEWSHAGIDPYNRSILRYLTPLECERLQGFEDNYTNIPSATDSNRYKALGNTMAVPVMRWIGERIDKVDKLLVNFAT